MPMKNLNFNLVEELSKKLSGVWRYNGYTKDADSNGCKSCVDLWKKIKQMDEEAAGLLKKEIIAHVEGKKFD